MELPKNVTQIGEVGKDSRIYVEDYVVSYIKQMNRVALDKEIAVVLYGRRNEENGIVYYFLYGACKVTYLQREVRHLSQAQRQEIEGLRKKYFPGYQFLGYCLLNGEMVEGFHICEQDICRYIPGYAQFYEKNDSMLAYMLAVRDEVKPEQVNQEKYEEVKQRQEERRAAAARTIRSHRRTELRRADKKPFLPDVGKQRRMSAAVVGVFALLCLVGVIGLQDRAREEGIEDIRTSAKQWMENLGGSGDPGIQEDSVAVNADVKKDILVLEDKLEQALLEENSHVKDDADPAGNREDSVTGEAADEPLPEASPEPLPETSPEPLPEASPEPSAEPEDQEDSVAETVQVPEAVAYVVKRGDTLTRISIRQYGSDKRVADICSLNSISDPDDIKEGQIIMLPR